MRLVRFSSLRARLTAWTVLLIAVLLAASAWTTRVLLDRALQQNIDVSLRSMATSLAQEAGRSLGPSQEVASALEQLFGPVLGDRFYRLLDPSGRPDPRLPLRNRSQLPLSPEALRNAELGRETYETLRPLPGRGGQSAAEIRMLTWPVIERGRVVNLVQVALSLQEAETARSRVQWIFLGLAPLVLLGAAIGGFWLVGRALRPLDAMVETAERIGAEDLSTRVGAVGADDELRRLADVLNEMLDRLEQAFSTMRQFSADAAHELRTPLTILKGELEVALRSSLEADPLRPTLTSCIEEVDRLGALVEDLLLLARLDGSRDGPPFTAVDLGQLVEDARPGLEVLAGQAGLRLDVRQPGPAVVRGNEPLLFRLIFNLGENAIKYTPSGGRVDIGIENLGSQVRLTVRDTGVGISEEERGRIFDRFQRGDRARSGGGTGLGLALVRSIVLLHHGRIHMESSVGAGTTFSVTFMRDL